MKNKQSIPVGLVEGLKCKTCGSPTTMKYVSDKGECCPKCKDEFERKTGLEKTDGWDNQAMKELGITGFFSSMEKVIYEMNNCRRGSYCKEGGNTTTSMLEYLGELADEFIELVENAKQELLGE